MSDSNSSKKNRLMEQQTAVMAYLQDLLLDVPEHENEASTDNVVKAFPVSKKMEHKSDADLPQHKQTPITAEAEQKADKHLQSEPQLQSDVAVPVWADQEFQCLLFNVCGITLAVPLVKLNGVIHWNEELTPMPGHSGKFLGLLRHLEKNVKVIDTAQVILPANQCVDLEAPDKRLQKILLIDDGNWGLACNDIGEVVDLNKTDVRWRTDASKRPWLAGTVSARLCALLDTDVMATMLSEGQIA